MAKQQRQLVSHTLYEHVLKYLQDPDSISNLKRIHAVVITNGLLSKSVLACRLLRNYALLTGVGDVRKLFDSFPKQTVHTYNYMIKAYFDVGHYDLALRLYSQMFSVKAIPPDGVTLNIIAGVCTCLEYKLVGKVIHGHVLVNGFGSDIYLATSFIDFYSKCDCIDDARKVFDRTTERDDFVWTVMISGYLRSCDYCKALGLFSNMREAGWKAKIVTWNALLAGLVHGGLVSDALREFRRMQSDGVQPDKITLTTILPAFSQFATLKFGIEAHAYIVRMAFEFDLFVVGSLVDMYAKCGKLVLARCLFDQVQVKDIGFFNTMISGYGMHGQSKAALKLFHEMRVSDLKPNAITFTSVLSACSHTGMVNEGRRCFGVMVSHYGIIPCYEHYTCMVDMFGRAGMLKEAYEFIRSMPVDPSKDVWRAFLSACRNQRDWKLAEIANKHILGYKDAGVDAGYHIMMSNIYTEASRWVDAAKFRIAIRDEGLKKRTGFSWIEVGDVLHFFHMADTSHPQSGQIYALLKNLEQIKSDLSR